MNAESPAQNEHYLRVFRQRFRDWRGARPFWAGLFVLFGGFPIMYFPYAHIKIGALTVAMATTAGAGSLIIGVLLVVLGLTLWFQQHVRVFAGVAAILLALVSIPVSNFGGFVVGFLFALIGGAMAVAWAPGVPPEPQAVQEDGLGEGGAPGAVDGMGEANHLSGTSPANGTNGRHSAG
ncbi:DUF6114 domain-containing protein [Streptomyces sp. NPDC093984]|uniref:DUF6114 domain-containing protein n=1 Tax=Streptomyces sp. NPDC093984 TaxID=3366052 RepID=UPI00380CF77F